MAAYSQIFRAIITADAGGAVKEYRKYENMVDKSSTAAVRQNTKVEKSMNRVKMAAGAIGLTAAAALGKHAVNAARDLTESINAVNVMYGDSADAILQISESAATGVGLSERAFNESAVAVGGFVNQIASIRGTGAAGVLDELITRAADFGSVFNIDVDEALQRFRSGLAGETEPLRRFGINLLQSEVNAYAMANGIGEAGRALTEEEKVLARFELLLEKTSKMQGDFARTSGELANQQRIARAELENLAAEFGEQLIPAAIGAIGAVRDFIAIIEAIKVPEALGLIVDGLSDFRDIVAGPDLDRSKISIDVGDESTIGSRLAQLRELRGEIMESRGMFENLGNLWNLASAEDQGVEQSRQRYWATVEALQELAKVDSSAVEPLVADLVKLQQAAQNANNTEAIEWARVLGVSDLKQIQSLRLIADALSGDTGGHGAAGSRHTAAAHELAEAKRAEREAEERRQVAFERGTRINAEYSRIYANMPSKIYAVRNAFDAAAAAVSRMRDQLNIRSGVLAISDQIDVVEDLKVAWEEAEDGTREAEQAARDYEQGLIDLKNRTFDWADSIDGLPDEVTVLMDAAIDRQDFDYIEEWIGRLENGVTLPITIAARNTVNDALKSAGATRIRMDEFGNLRSFDTGGVVPGMRGSPQLAVVHGGETILPTHKSTGSTSTITGSTINLTVNAGLGTDGQQVGRQIVEQIKRYERLNGAGWRVS